MFVRLKEKYGNYLVLVTPGFSFLIKKGEKNDPAGFEVDRGTYEKIKKYVEPVSPKPKKKSEKKFEDLISKE